MTPPSPVEGIYWKRPTLVQMSSYMAPILLPLADETSAMPPPPLPILGSSSVRWSQTVGQQKIIVFPLLFIFIVPTEIPSDAPVSTLLKIRTGPYTVFPKGMITLKSTVSLANFF